MHQIVLLAGLIHTDFPLRNNKNLPYNPCAEIYYNAMRFCPGSLEMPQRMLAFRVLTTTLRLINKEIQYSYQLWYIVQYNQHNCMLFNTISTTVNTEYYCILSVIQKINIFLKVCEQTKFDFTFFQRSCSMTPSTLVHILRSTHNPCLPRVMTTSHHHYGLLGIQHNQKQSGPSSA